MNIWKDENKMLNYNDKLIPDFAKEIKQAEKLATLEVKVSNLVSQSEKNEKLNNERFNEIKQQFETVIKKIDSQNKKIDDLNDKLTNLKQNLIILGTKIGILFSFISSGLVIGVNYFIDKIR